MLWIKDFAFGFDRYDTIKTIGTTQKYYQKHAQLPTQIKSSR